MASTNQAYHDPFAGIPVVGPITDASHPKHQQQGAAAFGTAPTATDPFGAAYHAPASPRPNEEARSAVSSPVPTSPVESRNSVVASPVSSPTGSGANNESNGNAGGGGGGNPFDAFDLASLYGASPISTATHTFDSPASSLSTLQAQRQQSRSTILRASQQNALTFPTLQPPQQPPQQPQVAATTQGEDALPSFAAAPPQVQPQPQAQSRAQAGGVVLPASDTFDSLMHSFTDDTTDDDLTGLKIHRGRPVRSESDYSWAMMNVNGVKYQANKVNQQAPPAAAAPTLAPTPAPTAVPQQAAPARVASPVPTAVPQVAPASPAATPPSHAAPAQVNQGALVPSTIPNNDPFGVFTAQPPAQPAQHAPAPAQYVAQPAQAQTQSFVAKQPAARQSFAAPAPAPAPAQTYPAPHPAPQPQAWAQAHAQAQAQAQPQVQPQPQVQARPQVQAPQPTETALVPVANNDKKTNWSIDETDFWSSMGFGAPAAQLPPAPQPTAVPTSTATGRPPMYTGKPVNTGGQDNKGGQDENSVDAVVEEPRAVVSIPNGPGAETTKVKLPLRFDADTGLPAGGTTYTARVQAPSLGVIFFVASELKANLLSRMSDAAINSLRGRPVVGHVFEGSAALAAGVLRGHVLLSVNDNVIEGPRDAMEAVQECPRPLKLVFWVPPENVAGCELCNEEGMHMVKYDTVDKGAHPSIHEWKPKYVVVGGIVAKPWMMMMYRSKSEYDIAVRAAMSNSKKIPVKVKQFDLRHAEIWNDTASPLRVSTLPRYGHGKVNTLFFSIIPKRGYPIKVSSSEGRDSLMPVLEGTRRAIRGDFKGSIYSNAS